MKGKGSAVSKAKAMAKKGHPMMKKMAKMKGVNC